jgi:serine/threonine-protein kinase
MADDEDLLRTGGALEVAAVMARRAADRFLGKEFKGYRLERLIGEGGMGLVFEGVRTDGEFDRHVAVKLVPNATAVDRFLRERQIHAQLNHPNIARLYDAGTTEEGIPFLVMELVEGERIDTFCASQRLPLERRVRLLVEVAEALAAAHSGLIIHRDIKPSNVIVDADGHPKLLDFGIAKLLESDDGELSRDARPFTPNYASPEQLLERPVGIASDVYQMGALIALVCAEQEPFAESSFADAVERAGADEVALAPGLRARLPRDLYAVVRQCLRNAPGDRYANVNALVDDLRRYLDGFPVLARNPGVLTRARKLVQRNPLTSAAAALTVVAALGGNWWYTRELTRSRDLAEAASLEADRQRRQAETEAGINREVTGFLVGLFQGSDPELTLGAEVSARELLDRGVASIEKLADQPAVQTALLRTMGEVYGTMAEYEAARPLLENALARSDTPVERLRSSAVLGNVLRELGEYDAAIALLESAAADPAIATVDPQVAYQLRYNLQLAYADVGRYEDAAPLVETLLAARDAASPRQLIDTLTQHASLARETGRLDEAEVAFHQAIELETETSGPVSAPLGALYNNLGNLHLDRSENDAAQAAYRQALEIFEQVYGPEHPLVGGALGNLATIELRRERYDSAADLYHRAIDIIIARRGPDHPDVARGYGQMGALYLDLGELDRAEEMLLKAHGIFASSFSASSREMSTANAYLGKVYNAQGRYADAEPLLRDSVAVREATLAPDHLHLLDAANALLENLRAQGKEAEAEALESRYDFTPFHATMAQYAEDRDAD